MGSGHPGRSRQLEWEPETLLEEGCSRIAASAAAPVQPPELPGRVEVPACSLPAVSHCPGASRFPGGTFSGSGNREFYSGCSSECTKGKGFRSRSLKLPHFSLSQMTVSVFGGGGAGRGVGGQAGALPAAGCAGRGCVTLRCLSRSGKLAHHPLPACRRLWPALTKTDPTVSTGVTGGGRGRGWAGPGTAARAGVLGVTVRESTGVFWVGDGASQHAVR